MAMKLEEFKIGEFFYVRKKYSDDAGKWKCTDIGSRVITAIYCNKPDDWLDGPPYLLQEIVFTPDIDFEVCYLTEAERDADR